MLSTLGDRVDRRRKAGETEFREPVDEHLPGVTLVYDDARIRPYRVPARLPKGVWEIVNYDFHNDHHRLDFHLQALGMGASVVPLLDRFDSPITAIHNVTPARAAESITVDEFRALPERQRRNMGLVKPGPIEYAEQPVPLPPVFMDLWLADGARNAPQVASYHEAEVRTHLQEVATLFDLHVRYYGGVIDGLTTGVAGQYALPPVRTPADRGELRLDEPMDLDEPNADGQGVAQGNGNGQDDGQGAGDGHGAARQGQQHIGLDPEPRRRAQHEHVLEVPEASRRHPNRVINALRGLGVYYEADMPRGPLADSKRIPPGYLFNSRKVRQQLLAGFVDGDGTYDYSTNTAVIGQSTHWHLGLIEDLIFLIRSLGYPMTSVWLDPDGHTTADGKPCGELYSMCMLTFHLWLDELPCLLTRKHVRRRKQRVQALHRIVGLVLRWKRQLRCRRRMGKGLFLRHNHVLLVAL